MVLSILYLTGGIGCFLIASYFSMKEGEAKGKKEPKKSNLWGALSMVCLAAGILFCPLSLNEMHRTSIGKAGSPEHLNNHMFYRALGPVENLKGEKFAAVQDAIEVTFIVKSNSQPARGAFVRPVKTPNGYELEIIDVNGPGTLKQ